jgi:hypothetical protein
MEQIIVAAICLVAGIGITALTHPPAHAVARAIDATRHDVAVWLRF